MKPLTQRELHCLKWVAIGKTSWETARILGLAESTINAHIQSASRKLGVNGRQAAIIVALGKGLLELNTDPGANKPIMIARPHKKTFHDPLG